MPETHVVRTYDGRVVFKGTLQACLAHWVQAKDRDNLIVRSVTPKRDPSEPPSVFRFVGLI